MIELINLRRVQLRVVRGVTYFWVLKAKPVGWLWREFMWMLT